MIGREYDYTIWVRDWEKEGNKEKESPRVFCHNDTQYCNLLKLKKKPHGQRDHHQVPLSSSFLILS
jgi:choline kinase